MENSIDNLSVQPPVLKSLNVDLRFRSMSKPKRDSDVSLFKFPGKELPKWFSVFEETFEC